MKHTTHDVTQAVDIHVKDSGVAAMEPITIPQVFKRTLSKHANDNALNVQRGGKWVTYTWQEYYNNCVKFAKSLLSLGFEPFQAVNIIGFNSPEWFFADVGTIFAGGVAAGIYTTNGPNACKFISQHSKAAVVICDGMKQLEKFVSIAEELPELKMLVVYNETVPEDFVCKVPVKSFEDFLEIGNDVEDSKVNDRMNALKPGNCSTLIYTSGTTGNPKAVMISHDNAIWTITSLLEGLGGADSSDRLVSYLPLSHIAAQVLNIFGPMLVGARIFFAKPDALKGSLGGTLKEVRPTIFFGVPRVWEKIAEKMKELGAQTVGLKKMIAMWAKEKGAAKTELAQYGNSGGAPCGYGCAHRVVLSKIKEALGLDQSRVRFTGAAPIAREVLDFFGALDIPIYELFGQSECTGPHCVNFPDFWKIGTCGRNLPGTEMKIIPDTGELVYRGRHIMMGYMNDKEKTDETVDSEGWLHSGDVAKVDEDGFMSITGRIKELIITAGGENVAPVPIEDNIKEAMGAISNVMVIGDKRKFLSCVLTVRVVMNEAGEPTDELDATALAVAKEIGSGATKVSQVQTCPKFKEYFDNGLKKANKVAVSRAQCVQKWLLLERDFSVAGGELTPTLKLKRRIVMAEYEERIDGIYA